VTGGMRLDWRLLGPYPTTYPRAQRPEKAPVCGPRAGAPALLVCKDEFRNLVPKGTPSPGSELAAPSWVPAHFRRGRRGLRKGTEAWGLSPRFAGI
jgi:hypothetical protein